VYLLEFDIVEILYEVVLKSKSPRLTVGLYVIIDAFVIAK